MRGRGGPALRGAHNRADFEQEHKENLVSKVESRTSQAKSRELRP